LSIPVSIVIFAVLMPSRRLRLATIGGVCAVALSVALLSVTGAVPLLSRFASSDVLTVNGRTYLWDTLLQRWSPTEWLGYGHFASDTLLAGLQIGANGVIGNGVIATSSSNLFIQALYDHGIIGLALLLIVFAAFGIAFLRAMPGSSIERRLLIAAAMAVLFNMLIQSIEVSDFWDQSIAVYFWFAMALPFAAYWFGGESGTSAPSDVDTLDTPAYDDAGSAPSAAPALSIRTLYGRAGWGSAEPVGQPRSSWVDDERGGG